MFSICCSSTQILNSVVSNTPKNARILQQASNNIVENTSLQTGYLSSEVSQVATSYGKTLVNTSKTLNAGSADGVSQQADDPKTLNAGSADGVSQQADNQLAAKYANIKKSIFSRQKQLKDFFDTTNDRADTISQKAELILKDLAQLKDLTQKLEISKQKGIIKGALKAFLKNSNFVTTAPKSKSDALKVLQSKCNVAAAAVEQGLIKDGKNQVIKTLLRTENLGDKDTLKAQFALFKNVSEFLSDEEYTDIMRTLFIPGKDKATRTAQANAIDAMLDSIDTNPGGKQKFFVAHALMSFCKQGTTEELNLVTKAINKDCLLNEEKYTKCWANQLGSEGRINKEELEFVNDLLFMSSGDLNVLEAKYNLVSTVDRKNKGLNFSDKKNILIPGQDEATRTAQVDTINAMLDSIDIALNTNSGQRSFVKIVINDMLDSIDIGLNTNAQQRKFKATSEDLDLVTSAVDKEILTGDSTNKITGLLKDLCDDSNVLLSKYELAQVAIKKGMLRADDEVFKNLFTPSKDEKTRTAQFGAINAMLDSIAPNSDAKQKDFARDALKTFCEQGTTQELMLVTKAIDKGILLNNKEDHPNNESMGDALFITDLLKTPNNDQDVLDAKKELLSTIAKKAEALDADVKKCIFTPSDNKNIRMAQFDAIKDMLNDNTKKDFAKAKAALMIFCEKDKSGVSTPLQSTLIIDATDKGILKKDVEQDKNFVSAFLENNNRMISRHNENTLLDAFGLRFYQGRVKDDYSITT